MRMVLFWSDQPLESDRAERHLDIPAVRQVDIQRGRIGSEQLNGGRQVIDRSDRIIRKDSRSFT